MTNSLVGKFTNVISFFFPQDLTRSFRRQLEDKRAVVENNLMAGRQFLAAANANGGDNKEQQGEGEGELE